MERVNAEPEAKKCGLVREAPQRGLLPRLPRPMNISWGIVQTVEPFSQAQWTLSRVL
jgi:hypothetical protein